MGKQNNGKKFPLSYSRVNTFKNCPSQFEHLYILKDVVDAGSDATEYGTRVHESLELYARTGDTNHLTRETKQWKSLIDKLTAKQGDKYYEYKLSVNPHLEPCDWFADDVWMRGVADVLVVDGDVAYCLDWKTGKVREDLTQLQVFASLIMFCFPQVNKVKCSFIWLVHDQTTNVEYDREHLDIMWQRLDKQFEKVQEAVDLGVFPAKPSYLCNWCAAKSICQYR